MPNHTQRYNASNLFNMGSQAVYGLAQRFKNGSDKLIEDLLNIEILDLCDFNSKNYMFMQRLMNINIYEKQTTLNSLGDDAHLFGNPDEYPQQAISPSYVSEIDYKTFINNVRSGEKQGELTTRSTYTKSEPTSYVNHNEIYTQTQNLYPDDINGRGEFQNKWSVGKDQNSILYKTKKLFNQNKVNTIISRFATNADGMGSGVSYNGSIGTRYGESHGRNLLKRGAEKDGTQYLINGYNNPYCRVWTHHYQYDKYGKTIRPFTELNDKGEPVQTRSLKDFHTWVHFQREGKNEKGQELYGWKNNNGKWDYSALQDNGLVRISPSNTDIETPYNTRSKKSCMFSIENLAWKGCSPYEFENALSWEQRGPNGGRIMWFPPYGISFNETTNASWQPHTFIGRGEDVYTYTKTERSGTLSFLMVVDHPSIVNFLDYKNKKSGVVLNSKDALADTDLLRFFAGCDSGDSNDPDSILSYAHPFRIEDMAAPEAEPPVIVEQKDKKPENTPTDPEVPDEVKEIVFFVFYPNNYSGYYDIQNKTGVEPMAYLLNGSGAQKSHATPDNGGGSDVPISFDNMSTMNTGYEMGIGGPISNESKQIAEGNFIIGSAKPWYQYSGKRDYVYSPTRLWFYRIDGEYKVPASNDYRNTYAQRLVGPDNSLADSNPSYQDTVNHHLNCKTDNIITQKFVDENSKDKLYAFSEVACAIARQIGKVDAETVLMQSADITRVDEVEEVLKNYTLESVNMCGFSNVHGNNASEQTNNNRNKALAEQRANSVKAWLSSVKKEWGDDKVKYDTTYEPEYGGNSTLSPDTKNDVSSLAAKMYRSVKITMSFRKSSSKNLSETTQPSDITEGIALQRSIEYADTGEVTPNGDKIYTKINSNEKWIKNGENWVKYTPNNITIINNAKDLEDKFAPESGKKNNIRYDQENKFFQTLKATSPLTFDSLIEKLQYFDPAFHSMTPEGFNARLTFLQQCMRQGNTISMSDHNGKTANNLAFGRPPFCVLRIGDFYHQMIVIDNISVEYDVSNGIQWDLNTEGIGVQPLLARVNMSFKFIGGGDLEGPIRRLQNAMTFNYYANTGLYDNRADDIQYHEDGSVDAAKSRIFAPKTNN